MIWTSDAQIAQLINFALIVDACKEFNFNKKKSEFFEKYLSKLIYTFNFIIKST